MNEEIEAIPHDGKKPDWLEDDAYIYHIGLAGRGARAGTINFRNGTSNPFLLPADHWAAPVLRAGLTPWNPKLQGPTRPDDWDGTGRLMIEDGQITDSRWFKFWTSQIIGYEPAQAPVTLPKDAGVTQGDREAAADYMDEAGWGICPGLDTRAGHADTNNSGHHLNESQLVQAFARHRHQSQAAVTGMVEALEELLSSITGVPVGQGDGHTYMVSVPSPVALKKARAALASYRGK